MTAFQTIILFSPGAPDTPSGGSSCNLLKSRINRRRAVVDIFVELLRKLGLNKKLVGWNVKNCSVKRRSNFFPFFDLRRWFLYYCWQWRHESNVNLKLTPKNFVKLTMKSFVSRNNLLQKLEEQGKWNIVCSFRGEFAFRSPRFWLIFHQNCMIVSLHLTNFIDNSEGLLQLWKI